MEKKRKGCETQIQTHDQNMFLINYVNSYKCLHGSFDVDFTVHNNAPYIFQADRGR